MNKREKILLTAFAILFAVIIGGGLLVYSLKNYREVTEQTVKLREQVDKMTTSIAQGADWKGRADWVEKNIPVFASIEEARIKLGDIVQSHAQKAGVPKLTLEYLDQPKPIMTADSEGNSTDDAGYWDKTTVKITLNEVKEKGLFAWIYALQEPKSFLGITRFQMSPSTKGKTVNCEIEITQFYQQSAASGLSKAN